jgi:hypothetical protein
LVAGITASAVTIFFGRGLLNSEVPLSVLWLGSWAALFAAQAASWAVLSRKRTN